jgi:xanthine dehydrogenase YagR molybdenum-binding subunit
MFTLSGHQPATRQVVRLGATADGRLTGLSDYSVNASAWVGDYVELTTNATSWLYDSPAIGHTCASSGSTDRT